MSALAEEKCVAEEPTLEPTLIQLALAVLSIVSFKVYWIVKSVVMVVEPRLTKTEVGAPPRQFRFTAAELPTEDNVTMEYGINGP